MTKELIRKEMSRIRAGLDAETLKLKSAEIAKNLFSMREFKSCRNILLYLSLDKEVQTGEIIDGSLAMGKKAHVPVVDRETLELKISELAGLSIEFKKGPYGIREPANRFLKITPPDIIDFVVAPGLAFDRRGGRVGYGGGYYDRLLRYMTKTARLVAVAFAFQVLDSVPQGESDIPVQKIITENETICCQ